MPADPGSTSLTPAARSRPGSAAERADRHAAGRPAGRARTLRHAAHGNRITFSPKVFIPLTMLCRDRCGYCTFAKAPARLESPYLSIDEVLDIARAGRAAGCHEALFTLGEGPEDRYPAARQWLADHGYASTVDYLVAACRAVLEETGLLPHANAGALDRRRAGPLRAVTGQPGDDDRVGQSRPGRPPVGAPDKTPAPAPGHPRGGRGRRASPSPPGSWWGSASPGPTAWTPWRPSPPATAATATCRR